MDAQAVQDQSDVFAFLSDPAVHKIAEPVTRIDTHGAAVFLAGRDAYKVKRAVHFPFMDFSTLELRRRACENELAVNKANARDLYLGVVPISRDKDGLNLKGAGAIVEWAVHLRRFDESRTLDRLAERGELDQDIVAKLADEIVAAHRRAPRAVEVGSTLSLERQIEETLDSLDASPEIFPPSEALALRAAMTGAFARATPLLLAREAQGKARRCHGDLHLRNIVMIESIPVLFDAIEFDDAIATCDILYDLAFLLMDLWTRGLLHHANLLLNRYVSACDDVEREIEGLAALPLFLSLRAAIRAKVTKLEPAKTESVLALAHKNFVAAGAFLRPFPLDLVAIGGRSGTGKSTLARAIAALIGRAPGALHLRSDVERKRLFGFGEYDRLPESAYRKEHSIQTYARLHDLAALALAAGQSVVLDAAHLNAAERDAAAELARKAGARFSGIWLEASTGLLADRVAARRRDASDATPEVVAAQAKMLAGDIDWRRLDATRPLEAIATEAVAEIHGGATASL
ncbi:AAA family ATPase [Methylocapsa acidiphila]|uniref:bifunctional aminoglycoside phosphotransferase/ATP-binding protein n=1 Tax=Methylocapsa acidiphila TaxID=133552 RepID=UPI0004122A46|nr:bifunctional aminoglycoside phosphotransferase/ATP-binding protein [Methylocapsa acidiphila]